jgi:hypothetical protein
MSSKLIASFSLLFLASHISIGFAMVNERDTTRTTPNRTVRVYTTTRLTTEKPDIDGVLDDAAWQTGEWAGDFTQWIPNEGANPSHPTELKILYDDRSIYVAIRAFDSEPEKISRKGGRRDELHGDMVGITFDSYHDHRTGFEFDVTSSGQKIDLVLMNPMNWDTNWDAVWYVATGLEDSAWTAEYEIPLSQLRYSSDYEQVWGLHCWRWIDRLQEESDWEPQSSTGAGILYQFGELHGIRGLPRSRRIEIMPYSLGRLSTFKKEPDNPFADNGHSSLGNLGIDAKIGLSSNFTADLTFNPDFGQVESDPSVMNLTAFETFFAEKRPFFLEGKNIFNFDAGDASIFYSRRIGQSPAYVPGLADQEYMKFPDNTTILSATKVSGKTADGLSIGVLQSLTANEKASIHSGGANSDVSVEPLTNFMIGRAQKDFKDGSTVIGGILTSTNRSIGDSHLEFLNRNAYTGGIDVLHHWKDKEFFVDAKFAGSHIRGSRDAIGNLQNASARYYQRPDADHLDFDSTRTSLSGYGGSIEIGKGSKGLWRYSTEFNWRSPGLDFNDMGFMQKSDLIQQENSISYFVNRPVSVFRTYSVGFRQFNNWDFGIDHLSSGGELNLRFDFLNKWAVSNSLEYTSEALDTRILRGGYAMLVPAIWTNHFNVRTDRSRHVYFEVSADVALAGNQRTRYYRVQPRLTFLPANTLRISMSLDYASNTDRLQYVDTKSVDNIDLYILAKIKQYTLGTTFRIDYNITPELSVQYYGSPFASVGEYSEFKAATDPSADNFDARYFLINPVLNGDQYEVTGPAEAQPVYTFSNPDFNFFQLRSNLVCRWEYRPGSQIYLVWSQDRTDFVQPGHESVSAALDNLADVSPNNIFLVKFNYWFNL